MRALLAVALVVTTGVHDSKAQCRENCPPPQTFPGPTQIPGPIQNPSNPSGSRNNVIGYIVGGVVVAIIGLIIANTTFGDPTPAAPPPQPPSPPNLPPVAQLPNNPIPSAPPRTTTSQRLRPSCNLPPAGETRFVPTEVILDFRANASLSEANLIAARYSMTPIETSTLGLTGRRLHRWRIDGGSSVEDIIRNLCAERLVAGVQPNYVYALAQEQTHLANSEQYAPERLNLVAAHRLARGNRVLVAVIDFGGRCYASRSGGRHNRQLQCLARRRAATFARNRDGGRNRSSAQNAGHGPKCQPAHGAGLQFASEQRRRHHI